MQQLPQGREVVIKVGFLPCNFIRYVHLAHRNAIVRGKCSLWIRYRLQFVRHLHSSIAVYGYGCGSVHSEFCLMLVATASCRWAFQAKRLRTTPAHPCTTYSAMAPRSVLRVCRIGLACQLALTCCCRICCLGLHSVPVSRSWTASATISPGTVRSLSRCSRALHQQS